MVVVVDVVFLDDDDGEDDDERRANESHATNSAQWEGVRQAPLSETSLSKARIQNIPRLMAACTLVAKQRDIACRCDVYT